MTGSIKHLLQATGFPPLVMLGAALAMAFLIGWAISRRGLLGKSGPQWSDVVSAAVGLGSICVAWYSYEASMRQYEVAKETLAFARAEAAGSSAETRAAIEIARDAARAAGRSASAAENEATLVGTSVQIARGNLATNEGLLRANLAGDVHIELAQLVNYGAERLPLIAIFHVNNVGKTTIVAAEVSTNIRIVEAKDVDTIFQEMPHFIKQTIPLAGKEDESTILPYLPNRELYRKLATGEFRVVAAVAVRWRDPGGRDYHQRSRCWQWFGEAPEPRNLACRGLDEY